AARLALPARDLERDADQVAGLHRGDGIPDVRHLPDALMAERVRPSDGRESLDEGDVDVAGRERPRVDEGLAVALQLRVRGVAPLELALLDERACAHVCTPPPSV